MNQHRGEAMRLDHVNIKGPRALIEQVRDFYCDVLGLEEGFRPEFGSPGHWLYAGQQPLVHLSIASDAVDRQSSGYLDHVAFGGEGLEDFRDRLEAFGVSYRSKYVPELAMTQLSFCDPAGIRLEINFVGEDRL